MSQSSPPRQKPVTLEKRKNLLYSSNKRRSIRAIALLSLLALALGLAIAYLLQGIVVIDETALRRPASEFVPQKLTFAHPEHLSFWS